MSSNASRSASTESIEAADTHEASIPEVKSPTSNDAEGDGTDDNRKEKNDKETSTSTEPSQHESKDTDGDNKGKGKDNLTAVETSNSHDMIHSQGDWQAIWAPMQKAYYFHNVRTNETTWSNPLHSLQLPAGEAQTSAGASTSYASASTAAQAAAVAAGIDPSLAYLDPSLALPGSTPAGTFTAKFNARTGAFARADARDPSHLSESERAKRMSEVYFDVGAWEREVEQRTVEEADGNGKKRKRPSKKDLERFKEQKRLKKIAKTAWLRT